MEVDIAKRNKQQIIENIVATVDEFNARDDISTRFGEPVVVFLSTTHPLFDTFFARGENDHPKKIYRPGNTLIIHYVPWDGAVAKSNEGSNDPSEEWLAADRESLWLAMEINKVIKKTLDKVGRIHSNTSTMIDWDKEKHRYGWSNKIAAFIGGVGKLGPAGSLHVDGVYGGRAGSISTAALYADDIEMQAADGGQFDSEALEEMFRQVMRSTRFVGWSEEKCSDELIASCPGGAISSEGIDRQKCQNWCETIDKYTPAPEVCGKCFKFK